MIPAPEKPSVQIRKMTIADLPQVVAIDHSSFTLPWPESSFHFELERNECARAWVAEIIDSGGTTVIAGMIVGWLIVDEIHIATVATAHEFRGRGIGGRLMKQLLGEAYKEGARKSFLEVRRGNDAARRMYQQLGYREDGVRLRYYEDNHEDAILMSLQNIDPQRLNL